MEGHRFPFCKMRKRKALVGQALLVVMMSLLSSSMGGQSLTCYNDVLETLTCEWNISALERTLQTIPDKCFIKANCDDLDKIQSVQSGLSPLDSQPEMFKATIKFTEMCLYYPETIDVSLQCGKIKMEQIDIIILQNVKLNPPEKLKVDGANVSWTLGSPHSGAIKRVKFQLQYKTLDQSWEDLKLAQDLPDSHCFLQEDNLILGRKYEVRVRSIPVIAPKFWSDWSLSTEWTSTVGKKPSPDPSPSDLLWLTPSLTGTAVVIIVIIIIGICCFHPVTCSLKYPVMHNPFEDLYQHHGGDVKSWVGTFVGPDSFFKASMEHISAVEVCKAHNLTVPLNTDESKRKSFSNSMYFLSQSSKCSVMDQLEPCSEQCPYGPAGGGSVDRQTQLATEVNHNSDTGNKSSVSEPLEMSSSYKDLPKLRLDVQSPDSGFAAGSDQDSQEESGSEGLPSPPVVANVLPISSILPCPVPLIPHMASFPHMPFFSSSGFPWMPENPNVLQMLSSNIPTNIFIGNPDIISCSGLVEPASEDYMPVRNVQECTDFQMEN